MRQDGGYANGGDPRHKNAAFMCGGTHDTHSAPLRGLINLVRVGGLRIIRHDFNRWLSWVGAIHELPLPMIRDFAGVN